jgi:hypothetical protein
VGKSSPWNVFTGSEGLFIKCEVSMRIGVVVFCMSLSVLVPGSVLADPDSSAPVTGPEAATGTQEAAPAAAAVQAAPAAEAVTAQNPDEVVCKSSMLITGSRLGAARECHSVSWWNKHEQPAAQQQPKTEADNGH